MKKLAGLWIDHRKAVIVVATDQGHEMKFVVSNIESRPGRLQGSHVSKRFEAQRVPADDRRERHLRAQLNTYCDAVIACIRGADGVLIFGPGEARGELKKRIGQSKCGVRIVGMETADKMTNRQVLAKVRACFAE